MFDKNIFYPLRDKRIVKAGGDSITPSGQEAIVKLLDEYNLLLCCRYDDRDTIKDTVGFEWDVAQGEYRGKFTTRLSKLWKEKGKTISPEQLEQIGTVARANFSKDQDYILDFDDQFDWKAGDYGDSGSCYLGDNSTNNSYALTLLKQFGCLAVRFYKGEHGIGRAWLSCPKDINSFICWNFKGYDRILGGIILSSMTGLPYHTILTYNNGNANGLLYMTSTSGVLIGPDPITQYDFRKEWVEMCECGQPANGRRNANREAYCYDCFAKFVKCSHCGNRFRRKANEIYCPECHTIPCQSCGKEIFDAYKRGELSLCRDCYLKKICSKCGQEATRHTIEGLYSCDEHWTKCDLCGQPSLVGKKRKTEDGMACCKCYVNYCARKCVKCGFRHHIIDREQCE